MVRSFLSAVALAASSLVVSPLATPAVASPAPLTGDLATVQQHLHALDTMTADFSQTDRTGRTLTGVFTLKQPGRVRFQYAKGVPILLVADGKALAFIDYSVRQVQRWPVRESPLGVLIDPDRALPRYARVIPGDPRAITVEVADRHHPDYGKLTLVFARDPAGPAGLALSGWVALDSQGNSTAVRLTNQRFHVPVSDDTFHWDDPRKRH
jgi:outer membrane lipoprotein-sorting protein